MSADYMRQYRRDGERRGRTADRVRTMLRDRVLRHVQSRYPTTWETLWWVAWRELEGKSHRINDRARRLAVQWLMDFHPRVYQRILDECWAEVGGKRMEGRPRKQPRIVPEPSAQGDRRYSVQRRGVKAEHLASFPHPDDRM